MEIELQNKNLKLIIWMAWGLAIRKDCLFIKNFHAFIYLVELNDNNDYWLFNIAKVLFKKARALYVKEKGLFIIAYWLFIIAKALFKKARALYVKEIGLFIIVYWLFVLAYLLCIN